MKKTIEEETGAKKTKKGVSMSTLLLSSAMALGILTFGVTVKGALNATQRLFISDCWELDLTEEEAYEIYENSNKIEESGNYFCCPNGYTIIDDRHCVKNSTIAQYNYFAYRVVEDDFIEKDTNPNFCYPNGYTGFGSESVSNRDLRKGRRFVNDEYIEDWLEECYDEITQNEVNDEEDYSIEFDTSTMSYSEYNKSDDGALSYTLKK